MSKSKSKEKEKKEKPGEPGWAFQFRSKNLVGQHQGILNRENIIILPLLWNTTL